MPKIIVVTAVPRFSDAGTHMRCELTSDGEEWAFYIPWHLTQQALPACAEALDAHLRRASNVSLFERASD